MVDEPLTTEGLYRKAGNGGARDKWLWWPLNFTWSDHWGFGQHGVQTGAKWVMQKRMKQHVLEIGYQLNTIARVWSIGPLRVIFGKPRNGW